MSVPRVLGELGSRWSGAGWGRGMVFGGGRLQGVGGWFSCGVARRGEGLVAVFRGYFASAGRIFISPGGLGAGLSGEV